MCDSEIENLLTTRSVLDNIYIYVCVLLIAFIWYRFARKNVRSRFKGRRRGKGRRGKRRL